jgi:hypothetical protein
MINVTHPKHVHYRRVTCAIGDLISLWHLPLPAFALGVTCYCRLRYHVGLKPTGLYA